MSKESQVILSNSLNGEINYNTVSSLQNPTNVTDCSENYTVSIRLIINLYKSFPKNMPLILGLFNEQQMNKFLEEIKNFEDFATLLYADTSALETLGYPETIERLRKELYKYYYIETDTPPETNDNANDFEQVFPENAPVTSSPDNIAPEINTGNGADKQTMFNDLIKNYTAEYNLLNKCPLAAIYLIRKPDNKLMLGFLKTIGSAIQLTDMIFDSIQEFYTIYKRSEIAPGKYLSDACKTIILQTDNTLVEITENNVSTLDKTPVKPNILSYSQLAEIAAANGINDYTSNDTDLELQMYKLMDSLTLAQNEQKKEAVANDVLKQEIAQKQYTIKQLLNNTEDLQKYQMKLEEQLKSAQDLNRLYASQLNSHYVASKSRADTSEIAAFAKEYNLESQPGYTSRAINAMNATYLNPDSVNQHHIVLPYNA